MSASHRAWVDVTTSGFDHERAALDFIRQRFSTRSPFRAWSNFTFMADDGTLNEVDLLVVSPTGVYLVEIKSYPGRLGGDAGTWRWTHPDTGRTKWFDNPLHLTERSASEEEKKGLQRAALRPRIWTDSGPSSGRTGRSASPPSWMRRRPS